MAVNNSFGTTAGLGDVATQMLSGGGQQAPRTLDAGFERFMASAMGQTGGMSSLTGTEPNAADSELGYREAARNLPRWLKEESAYMQRKNVELTASVTRALSHMPAGGERPTHATAEALKDDLRGIFDAAGTSPNAGIQTLESSLEAVIASEHAGSTATVVESQPETSMPQHSDVSKHDSGESFLAGGLSLLGGLAAAPLAKAAVSSVTHGGFAKASAGKPAAAAAATAKTTVATNKVVPQKKGPGGPTA